MSSRCLSCSNYQPHEPDFTTAICGRLDKDGSPVGNTCNVEREDPMLCGPDMVYFQLKG